MKAFYVGGLLAGCVAVVSLAAEPRATVETVRNEAAALDALLKPSTVKVVAAAHEQSHQKAPKLKTLSRKLAESLQIDPKTTYQTLVRNKQTLSGLCLAQLISQKTGQPIESLLGNVSSRAWMAELQKARITWDEAESHLEKCEERVAFLLLDDQCRITGP